MGEGTRGRGEGSKGFGSGGVGGRGTGPRARTKWGVHERVARGCPMPLGPRSGARGVSKGFGAGGVGGRGTGPRDGANFATCVVFSDVSNAYKNKKNRVFGRIPCGVGEGTRATTTNANTPNPCIPAHARDRNQVKTVLSEPSLDANTKCPSLHPCTCTRPQPGKNRGE